MTCSFPNVHFQKFVVSKLNRRAFLHRVRIDRNVPDFEIMAAMCVAVARPCCVQDALQM